MSAAAFTAVLWLGFLPVDRALHPDLPQLMWIRIGLTVVSLLALGLRFGARGRIGGQTLAFLVLAYLQLASGVISALCATTPTYIAGWLAVMMVTPSIPISRGRALTSLGLSITAFSLTAWLTGLDAFHAPFVHGLPNVVAVAAAAPMLVFALDHVRRTSWRRAVTVEEQRRELAADKARIDQLLHNILPAPIVTELKATDRVEPRHHAEVTVLFTDFCGFTKIAEQVTAEELVAELDSCFSAFDAIIARRGLERLKTIGDSYMAAAGVPVGRRTHVADAVLAALDITRAIEARAAARRAANRPDWSVRVGLHTGPLVAGVVGQTRFAYDVWGDTVNIASRMESAGEPGRVNLSGTTAARVADLFVLEPRGPLPAKNKGLVEMSFVVGIRPELSIGGAGLEPNPEFWVRARA